MLGVQGPLLERDTYEKCLKQIVDDCDAAYGYPAAGQPQPPRGGRFDSGCACVAPFRRHHDRSHEGDGLSHLGQSGVQSPGRCFALEKAAEYAAEVMKFKLEVDGAPKWAGSIPGAFPMVRSQQPRNRLFIFRLHGVRYRESVFTQRIPGLGCDRHYAGVGRCLPDGQRLSDRRSCERLR